MTFLTHSEGYVEWYERRADTWLGWQDSMLQHGN